MTNKCYSHNEEDFFCDLETPLERAVELFLDDNEDFVGETEIQIFSGEKVEFKASRFLPPIEEYLQDRAYGENENFSDRWCDKVEKHAETIQTLLSETLDKWADENNMQPNFFGVGKVSAETVKIKIDKDGYWSIVEDK